MQSTAPKTSFRDTLATADKTGKRKWVYVKKQSGRFTISREVVGYLLLAFLFIAPFIKINGYPLLLINILERRFVILGTVFFPQDMYILVLIFLSFLAFVILFTVVYGRVFCGWACPQTIFLEMVFRKIEYLIEGDYMKQKALDKSDWTWEKIWKKGLKHSIFFAFAVLIANTFLSYLIGVEGVYKIINEPFIEHIGGFFAMIAFSGAFYFVFAKFREQVCAIACPYGRLQGVMLDRDSVVVAYDHKRGEPRGKMRKGEERKIGDCIDCAQCVHVCPAGIDIRNGTQLECINCTLCIDACDEIMEKVSKPKGLIRYASINGIENGTKFHFNTRRIAYSIVLVALLSIAGGLLFTRGIIDATLLRAQGTTFQKLENGNISNLYNVKIINKSHEGRTVQMRLISPSKGTIKLIGDNKETKGEITLSPEGIAEGSLFLELPTSSLSGIHTKVEIGLYQNGELMKTLKTKFVSPF
ncbi:MAG: cytochrome c oxidase accessory protein CcoG [Thermoflexibacter sp.]|nr:cytochrome c oxidase accessory protein CcoG [Thermoflexibacter sp.]